MRKQLVTGLSSLALVLAAGCAAVQTLPAGHPAGNVELVPVAAPTGDREVDRANIQSAFDAVKPGGTVQFAPETYVRAGAKLTVPDVTVLGHPEGTVLRGCDPEALTPDPSEDLPAALFECTGLYIQAEHQTVRGLTFEYIWHGIVVGPYPTTMEEATARRDRGEFISAAYPAGGQRIEGITFRTTHNGVRVLGTGEEVSVVRDNDFIDVFHAIGIYGAPLHFLDNRVTVEEPERVPFKGYPDSAIIVSPGHTDCTGHVVAGNRIEGYPDAIYLLAHRGGTCRGVEIRDNTIRVGRVRMPEAWVDATPTYEDSTMVGVPITLMNRMEPVPGILKDVLVQGNRIKGAEGLGILVRNASHNRIVGNTITGIERRTPFPGLTWDGVEQRWQDANGSGIWVSPGSGGNEIVGNTFDDIASSAVFVEGDSNRVEVLKADDAVHDLGSGNEVSTPNDHVEPLYESKFVEAGGIRLQYMDFGGEGLPIIFLQDFHDYFYEGSEWPPFYAHFTSNHRVLAPYPRGWSESDDTGWGYDVATQSEDILRFMDALGIQRAVLAGRTGGTHEMTWIAEHHPERVAGLVYIQNLRVFPDTRDPLARSFIEMTWFTCHMGEESVARLGPRSAWRPHFLFDESARVNIPSIRFFAPEFEQHSRALSVLSRIEQWGSEAASRCADEATREKYDVLSKDKEQAAALRKALLEADPTRQANRAMERAFGDYMTTIVWNEEEEDLLEFEIPHIDKFLEKVTSVESGT